MRHSRATNCSDRSNALWGRGSRGESRSNALWGRGGRRAGVATAMVVLFAMASMAGAAVRDNGGGTGQYGNLKSYVPDTLLSAVQQNPTQSFDVILQGDRKQGARGFIQKILADQSGSADENVQSGNVKQLFTSIDGAQLALTGKQILRIAKNGIAQSIVPNETVKAQSYSNPQAWTSAVNVSPNWNWPASNAPTIAIVDSGIQKYRSD